jgi:capsule polysaccharide export protein KpsE/RkpR
MVQKTKEREVKRVETYAPLLALIIIITLVFYVFQAKRYISESNKNRRNTVIDLNSRRK